MTQIDYSDNFIVMSGLSLPLKIFGEIGKMLYKHDHYSLSTCNRELWHGLSKYSDTLILTESQQELYLRLVKRVLNNKAWMDNIYVYTFPHSGLTTTYIKFIETYINKEEGYIMIFCASEDENKWQQSLKRIIKPDLRYRYVIATPNGTINNYKSHYDVIINTIRKNIRGISFSIEISSISYYNWNIISNDYLFKSIILPPPSYSQKLVAIPDLLRAIDEVLKYHDRITVIGGTKTAGKIRSYGINYRDIYGTYYKTIYYGQEIPVEGKVVIISRPVNFINDIHHLSGAVLVRTCNPSSDFIDKAIKGIHRSILLSSNITHLYWHDGDAGKKEENILSSAHRIFYQNIKAICSMRPSCCDNDILSCLIMERPSYKCMKKMFIKEDNFVTWDVVSALGIQSQTYDFTDNSVIKSILRRETIRY